MFMVVVIALGMTSLRITLRELPLSWFPRPKPLQTSRIGRAQPHINFALAQCTPLLVLASLTVVAYSLRPPRPRLRRLAHRRGFVVSLAAVIGSLESIVELAAAHYFHNDDYKISMFNIIVFGLPQATGRWVIASWMVLALFGRMIPRGPLIDWAGFIA
jgi:hypothetical protein